MSDAQLLPCPFCGEDASIGRGPRGWFVNCQDCLASTNQLMNEPETEAEAIAAWNMRADDLRAALARVAELELAVQAFKDFDDMPTFAKRPDVFELRVRRKLLAALAPP